MRSYPELPVLPPGVRLDGIGVIGMVIFLMIIHNLHVRWSGRSVGPIKTDPTLIVNANAVLALSIAAKLQTDFQAMQRDP
jgi:hypothetical protein